MKNLMPLQNSDLFLEKIKDSSKEKISNKSLDNVLTSEFWAHFKSKGDK